ncbi:MAG: hypothetical protein K2P33_11320, partial [Acutalibacter sp.]|nr:hypothetical protein [Acutalibacter sp.]
MGKRTVFSVLQTSPELAGAGHTSFTLPGEPVFSTIYILFHSKKKINGLRGIARNWQRSRNRSEPLPVFQIYMIEKGG